MGMASTPPRRSDATRAAILRAARELFAAEGYERATIRAIAALARIDPSMVMRYYGSKEQLFAAAAQFDLRLPDLAALPREQVGGALVAHVLDRWEDDEALQVLLRAGVTNDATERMRSIFVEQLVPVVTALGGAGDARVRAGLAASQVLGFALCRYVLAWPEVSGIERDDVLAWLGPTVQRYLTGGRSPGSEPCTTD